ncbi:MAG: sugar ABC transporter substrate-binding protein [Candidatus Levybacteria bacterium]|nr:sugar ABC transporter substrate-binding protein [Candidatus Levybacteria bacterium]
MANQGSTIFENQAAPQNGVPQSSPPQEAPRVIDTVTPVQPVSASGPPPNSQPPQPPSAVSPSLESDEGSSFPLGAIIKVVIGIVAFLVLLFIIIRVVLPIFFQPKNEKVTLTYWGLWEDAAVLEPILSDFHKQNPNITVKYEKQDIKQYRERLMTRIANGDGPDIFRFHNTWLVQMSDILLPLPTDVITKEDFQKLYYPVVQKDLTRSGAIYGIPLHIDTLGLFTNNEIFQAAGQSPPETWDDFIRVSRGLTVKDPTDGKIKTAGAAIGAFNNVNHAPDIVSLLFLQNGADVYNLAATPKSAAGTLQFYTVFTTDSNNVWDTTLDPSLLAFAKGNVAMYFGYSWDIFAIKALNPQLSFSVSPVPHIAGSKPLTIASYWVEGVSQKSKHQKETLLFMKFLTKKEVQQKLYSEESKTRLFGELYSRSDLGDLLKDNKLVYPFITQAKEASSAFFVSDTYDNGLNTKANKYLEDGIQSMITDQTSPQSALDTIVAGVDQLLSQYAKQ